MVDRIHEIQESQAVRFRSMQRDEEILGVHEAADDAVDAAHHLGHVEFGTGHRRDREQRTLHVLGALDALHRTLEAFHFEQASSRASDMVDERCPCCDVDSARTRGPRPYQPRPGHVIDANDLLAFECHQRRIVDFGPVAAAESHALARSQRIARRTRVPVGRVDSPVRSPCHAKTVDGESIARVARSKVAEGRHALDAQQFEGERGLAGGPAVTLTVTELSRHLFPIAGAQRRQFVLAVRVGPSKRALAVLSIPDVPDACEQPMR